VVCLTGEWRPLSIVVTRDQQYGQTRASSRSDSPHCRQEFTVRTLRDLSGRRVTKPHAATDPDPALGRLKHARPFRRISSMPAPVRGEYVPYEPWQDSAFVCVVVPVVVIAVMIFSRWLL
jgi:hypothetical protein